MEGRIEIVLQIADSSPGRGGVALKRASPPSSSIILVDWLSSSSGTAGAMFEVSLLPEDVGAFFKQKFYSMNKIDLQFQYVR
jgi:hypothetical protein